MSGFHETLWQQTLKALSLCFIHGCCPSTSQKISCYSILCKNISQVWVWCRSKHLKSFWNWMYGMDIWKQIQLIFIKLFHIVGEKKQLVLKNSHLEVMKKTKNVILFFLALIFYVSIKLFSFWPIITWDH